MHAITNGAAVFAKFVGNPEGPHVLAAEVLGIECAKLLGIPTFSTTASPTSPQRR